jgi:membrane protein
MPAELKTAVDVFKATFSEWSEDKAPRLAAALAYYTLFSLAPLLLVVMFIAGMVFGQEAAQGEITGQLRGLVGEAGAAAIESIVEGARRKPAAGTISTIIGVVTLLIGATGLFGQLQDAMNTIWEVAPKPGRGMWGLIRSRFLSFTMVLGVAFLLLVSLVVTAGLSAAIKYLGDALPGADAVWQAVNLLVSFGVITLLFAMIYKVLPDVKIAWSDVWVGAAATALLFTVGKFLIGLYMGRASPESSYGAAGSLVALLIWVYYSAQILFLGAEFTQVYAKLYGSRIQPAEGAVPVTDEKRAEEGIPKPHRKTEAQVGRTT